MVTDCHYEIKTVAPWNESYDKPRQHIKKQRHCRQVSIYSYGFSSKKLVSFNFVAIVTIPSDFRAQENKVCHCFHCFPICLPWSDGTRCHDVSFRMLSFKPAFLLFSFTVIKRLFIFTFCRKGGIIYISEVIDISPSNLDSSLWASANSRYSGRWRRASQDRRRNV